MRMTASWTVETLGAPPGAAVAAASLMEHSQLIVLINSARHWLKTNRGKSKGDLPRLRLTLDRGLSNDYPKCIQLIKSRLYHGDQERGRLNLSSEIVDKHPLSC